MLYEDIQMSGSLDVTGSFVVPIGTTASASEYTGSLVYDSTDKKLYVWTGSWGVVGAQSNPESAPDTVFTDIPANLTASVSTGTNLISMSLTEADDLESTPYSASISGSSFEIVWSNADSSSGFIRNTTTLSAGTYYYNVTVFDSGSINSQSYNNQTVTVAAGPGYDIEYLVVAGGASGASNGGGGGAGGLLSGSISSISAGISLTATVGGGGAAQTTYQNQGNDGSDSSLIGTGVSYTSNGGGGGGSNNSPTGRDGGSGGGAGTTPSGTNSGGSGTVGQGNDGGDTNSAGHPYVGAGGGGAGQAGVDGAHDSPGDGGDGKQSGITGTLTYYAGGGGGTAGTGVGYTGDGGDGGQGGGGDSLAYNDDGLPGTANTGGGGGASGDGRNSGAGGSGIIILRMLSSNYSGTTTGSPTVTTDGSYKVVKFTSSGTYTT